MARGESPIAAIGKHGERWRRAAATFVLVLRESSRQFSARNGLETAATLAFYGFLSLIPLLLLVTFVLSQYVLSSQGATEAIDSLSSEMFPEFGRVAMNEIHNISSQGVWSAVTAVILLWSIMPFSAVTRGAFRRMVAPGRPTPFFKSRLMDLLGVVTLLALFVLVVMGKIIYATLSSRLLLNLPLGVDLLNFAASVLFAFAGLYFFYLVFTPGGVRPAHVVAGTLTALVLLFLLRPAFVAFLRFNPRYGFAFGSLKAIFLLQMWVYLSCVAILLGAEVIANSRRRDAVLLRVFLDQAANPARASRWLVDRYQRSYEDGETVFRQGEAGHEMFYVQSGAVRLTREGAEVRTMKTGEYFGEMSMLVDAPRSATAVAAADGTELVRIPRDHFEAILKDDPRVTLSMLRELARRLQQTDDRLSEEAAAGREPTPAPRAGE